jgi:predicted anti-sigma-YlaC factor YlaD
MKTRHLRSEELTGYIYRTLDDAQREIIDAHLVDCPACRASLTEQELRQRQVANELRSVLGAATPSAQMSFCTIRAQLQTRQKGWHFWSRLATFAPITLAITGLLLAFLGLWQVIGVRISTTTELSFGTFPTIACFFLVLASVEQFGQTYSLRPRFLLIALVAILLWLGSAFIGLLNLIVIQDLAIMAVITLGGSAADATPIAMMAVIVGALVYIGVVFGGGEYHYHNVGQPGSWKVFSLTLLGQLFLLILPYLIY